MKDKPPSLIRTFFEELKDGNPFIILLILMVLVAIGGVWVWQTTHNSVVDIPTPRFSHPSAVSPIQVLTARALTNGPLPVEVTPTPTVAATPKAAFFHHEKVIEAKQPGSVSFFFGR